MIVGICLSTIFNWKAYTIASLLNIPLSLGFLVLCRIRLAFFVFVFADRSPFWFLLSNQSGHSLCCWIIRFPFFKNVKPNVSTTGVWWGIRSLISSDSIEFAAIFLKWSLIGVRSFIPSDSIVLTAIFLKSRSQLGQEFYCLHVGVGAYEDWNLYYYSIMAMWSPFPLEGVINFKPLPYAWPWKLHQHWIMGWL